MNDMNGVSAHSEFASISLKSDSSSPLNLPHILQGVFSHLDRPALASCLIVNRLWYENALIFRWYTCFQTSKHTPPWHRMIKHLPYIHTLHWLVPDGDIEREKQLAQIIAAGKTAGRLRTLQVTCADDMVLVLKNVLPAFPGLLRLQLELDFLHLKGVPEIPLDEIVVGSKLQELFIGEHIQVTLTSRLVCSTRQPNSLMNHIRLLDITQASLSAQRCINIVKHMPNLKILALSLLQIDRTITHYLSVAPILDTFMYGSPSNCESTVQQFARDLVLACPKLDTITLRSQGHIDFQTRASNTPVVQDDLVELLVCSIIIGLLPQLSILNIDTALMHQSLFDILTLAMEERRSYESSSATIVNGLASSTVLMAPKLKKVAIDNPSKHLKLQVSSRTIQHFLEKCHTLTVLNLRTTPFDLNAITVNSPPSLSNPVYLSRPWACIGLKYLDLQLSNRTENYSRAPHMRRRLCQILIKQISLLTQLQALRISGGFEFPSILVRCGDFEPLSSLHLLEILHIGFDWDRKENQRCASLTSSGDEVVEDLEIAKRVKAMRILGPTEDLWLLDKIDMEWVTKTWPRLQQLCFTTACLDRSIVSTMQQLLDRATGPTRQIKLQQFSRMLNLSDNE